MQRKELIKHKMQLKEKYIHLCERYDFQGFVKSSDKYSYNKRMKYVENIIKEVLCD